MCEMVVLPSICSIVIFDSAALQRALSLVISAMIWANVQQTSIDMVLDWQISPARARTTNN